MTRKKWQQEEYDKADSKIMSYLAKHEGSTIIEIALGEGVKCDRNTVSKHLNDHKDAQLRNGKWFLTETLEKAEKKLAEMNRNEFKALQETLEDTQKQLALSRKEDAEERALISRALAEYRDRGGGDLWNLISNRRKPTLRANYRSGKR